MKDATHPDDLEFPEALALTVRVTHLGYGWGDDPKSNADNTSVSKAAFEFHHADYPKSPWAQKTRYYYQRPEAPECRWERSAAGRATDANLDDQERGDVRRITLNRV